MSSSTKYMQLVPTLTINHLKRFMHIFILLNIINLLPQCRGIQSMTASSSISTKSLGVYMLRSPESTIAPQGDEVLFECELNLEPERLEWRFRPQDSLGLKEDFIYIRKNPGYNVTTSEGTSKLRVYVNQKSIGEYQCIAWFGASAIASVPAKLMLATISLESSISSSSLKDENHKNERVPTMMRRVLPPQHINWKISPGNSIIVKCGDVTSYPPPVWSYYKDGAIIPSNIPQLSTGGLILSQVSTKDSGTYWCTAVNSITGSELKMPQKTTITIDFAAKMALKSLYKPPNVAVHPGESAILECPGVGNPIPTAAWSKRNGHVSFNRTKHFDYGLQIVDIVPEDQGDYVCKLDNGIDPKLVHTVRLTVLESPKIVEPPKATLTNESMSLELECKADGSPAPEIYWMINGDDTKWDRLIKSNGSKLSIKSVEKKHAGIVQCFARNEVGEVSESNLLQVNPKQIPGEVGAIPLGYVPTSSKFNNDHPGKLPKGRKKHKHPIMIPPSRPSVTRLSDESVMVRWAVTSNEGLAILFFKVQYRMLGDPAKKIPRSQWMTANEDIPPHVRSYELTGLKPDHFYRFRIAAVYTNNDNKLGNTSGKFHLQRGSQLGLGKSHLLAPTLTRIEPVSETDIVIHWQFPQHLPNPIDGFYAYFRPATTAGEYSKATVDSSSARHFKIDHLEPGTAYEFKLQSFTSSAASDFSAILTGKTLKPPAPPPVIPSVIAAPEMDDNVPPYPNYYYYGGGGIGILVLVSICICCMICKKKGGDVTESKSHPDHIQTEQNGYPVVSNGGRSIHKSSRPNGISTRVNITPNPLAQDSDKNRNVMELRFLPNSLGAGGIGAGGAVQQMQNNNHPSSQMPGDHVMMSSMPHRRTLERNARNIMGDTKMIIDGDCGVALGGRNNSSIRRTRRGSGSVPGSPRIKRGPSTELLQHNRSPMPIRAAGVKRAARLGRAENMSSGSLNSIEV